MCTLVIGHVICIAVGVKEPHISAMIQAYGQTAKNCTTFIKRRGTNLHPEFDFFSTFVQGLSSIEVAVAVIGFISAAAFAGFWATKFGYYVLASAS
ncbi:MAG: hypothetical protein ACLU99_01875 [Alphaproteobacteria bacterium]